MGVSPLAHEELFSLRQAIARIEGKPDHAARLAAGLDEKSHAEMPDKESSASSMSAFRFESLMAELVMPGLMVELRGERLQQAGATTGFALALAIIGADQATTGRPKRMLFIADPDVVRDSGLIYAPGLVDFGLHPAELVHALPRRIEDALWLAEAALASRAFSSVVLEIRGNPKKFGLTESRRLSLRVRGCGGRLYVLRQAGEEEASSASLRLSVKTAPAAARILADGTLLGGSIGLPAFSILAEKSRFPGRTEFILEWNPYDRRLCPLAHAGSTSAESPDSLPLLSTARDRSHRPPALGSVVAFGPILERAS